MNVTLKMCKMCNHLTLRRSLILFCGGLEFYGLSDLANSDDTWLYSCWKLKKQGNYFLSSLFPSCIPCSFLVLIAYFLPPPSLPKRISDNYVLSRDGNLLSCSLCLFFVFLVRHISISSTLWK